MKQSILDIIYMIGAVGFIFGIKMLGNPEKAKKGNLIAAFGMGLAIFGTIFLYEHNGKPLNNYLWIFGGLIVGTVIGTMMAKKVKMTGMPQMVSFFNGMGGACAALISLVEFNHLSHEGDFTQAPVLKLIIIFLGLIIGSISFAGSMIAFGKLDEKIKDKTLPLQQVINIGLMVVLLGIAFAASFGVISNPMVLYLLLVLSLIYGVLFVMPIGGADMPVVISLLNSFTGVAAAMGGFLYDNKVMLFGGILVGSAGTLLTVVMCKAMNRSLSNVLFGVMAGGGSAGNVDEIYANVRSTSPDDIAMILDGAQRVVFVPGYGMAVAQAQHAVRELSKVLEARGAVVEYAIHPVAGRMPGHMNVLLAEADVSYDKLKEMDEINPTLDSVDVAIVIGANDVVNPSARTDPKSPIAGMPIIDVDKCRTVIVIKRSLSPGFAGIPNPLFAMPNTLMYYADGQQAVLDIVKAVKAL